MVSKGEDHFKSLQVTDVEVKCGSLDLLPRCGDNSAPAAVSMGTVGLGTKSGTSRHQSTLHRQHAMRRLAWLLRAKCLWRKGRANIRGARYNTDATIGMELKTASSTGGSPSLRFALLRNPL